LICRNEVTNRNTKPSKQLKSRSRNAVWLP